MRRGRQGARSNSDKAPAAETQTCWDTTAQAPAPANAAAMPMAVPNPWPMTARPASMR